jgi:hypothetical protein
LERWEGIWVPKTKTFKELGIDLAEPPGKHSSDIGPIRPAEYLPFLIAVRRIIEAHDPIEHRIEKLREMLTMSEWKKYVRRYGPSHICKRRGVDWVIEYFFPRFIKSIQKLTPRMVDELSRLRLDTPNRIAAVSDEILSSVKGIGPAKLIAIREHCAHITEKRDADRVENVIR